AAARPGYSLAFDAPYLWEFVLRCPHPAAEVLAAMRQRGVLGGVDLGSLRLLETPMADCLLVAVTEMNGRASLDAFVEALP
ncbi:MAG TPA: glycine dehydrogenase, partial [Candidatus Dormibacteraeota bacterium]